MNLTSRLPLAAAVLLGLALAAGSYWHWTEVGKLREELKLARSSFDSLEDLRTRLLEFIDYFNKTMAKPFKWTYKGRVLQGA